jgi:hypothetical protein
MNPASNGAGEAVKDSALPYTGASSEAGGGAVAPTQQAAQALHDAFLWLLEVDPWSLSPTTPGDALSALSIAE